MPACRDCHRFDPRREVCTVERGSPIRKCVIALLEQECAQVRGRVLEIGCGGWDFSKRLLEKNGCEWFGVDPMLVDKKGRRSVATHRGTVSRLPFPGESFDYVLGNQTMEHWHEYGTSYARGLAEIYRVLKPSGVVSLNVPIHLHGDKLFVRGDIEGIRGLFSPSLWSEVNYEPWRKDYEPMEPYQGWRLCGYSDAVVAGSTQSAPSSWIMQIRAVKRGSLKTWQVRLIQFKERILQ